MRVVSLKVGMLKGLGWRCSHGDKSTVLRFRSPLKRTEGFVRAEGLWQAVLKLCGGVVAGGVEVRF